MTHLMVQLLALTAFGALALATNRQQDKVVGHRLSLRATRGLRLGGWSLLALALVAAIQSQGWALGLVSYSGHTSLAAGLVYATLIANERRRIPR